jgi:transposase
MFRKQKRQLTPEDKLQILEKARQPNTTVPEVLRSHQVDPTTFCRWEQAKDAIRDAMGRDRRRTESDAKEREIERLRAELAKKSRIIAEAIEENLELKKNSESGRTDAVHGGAEGGRASDRPGGGDAHRLGYPPHPEAPRYSSLVYYAWHDGAEQKRLDDPVPDGRCLTAVLREEKEVVITYVSSPVLSWTEATV